MHKNSNVVLFWLDFENEPPEPKISHCTMDDPKRTLIIQMLNHLQQHINEFTHGNPSEFCDNLCVAAFTALYQFTLDELNEAKNGWFKTRFVLQNSTTLYAATYNDENYTNHVCLNEKVEELSLFGMACVFRGIVNGFFKSHSHEILEVISPEETEKRNGVWMIDYKDIHRDSTFKMELFDAFK